MCGEPVSRDLRGRERVSEQAPEPKVGGVTGEVPEPILDSVQQDLSKRTGAGPAAIEVVRAESVVWNDGSLGCPQPGVNYRMAPTRGYRVVLRHGGREYDYRVVARSGSFVLCEGSRRVGPTPRQ